MKSLRIIYKDGEVDKVLNDSLIAAPHEITLLELMDHIEEMKAHAKRRLLILTERQAELTAKNEY